MNEMVQGKREFKERRQMLTILEKEELEAFEEIRWREHLSLSELGRKAIVEYINAHGEGNDTFKLDSWNENPNFQAVPSILNPDWKTWKTYFEDCNKEDFFKLLKALGDRREQAIGIMKERELKLKSKIKYKTDSNATSHYVPTLANNK